MKHYNLYQHTRVYSLKELTDFCAAEYAEKTAFSYEKGKDIVSVSYSQFRSDGLAFGTYLFDKGYRECHIAILGENSYFWLLSYFAVTNGKSVAVPIDKDLSPDQVDYLLRDSECKLLICSDQYADIAAQLHTSIDTINMKDLPDLLKEGMRLMKEGHLEYSAIAPGKDDLASIVYTSGTTGKPKGVMLSHNNLCSSMYGSCCNVWLDGASLLILPLHHTFGLVAGVLMIMLYGYPVCINRSLKRLSSDFQKYKPQNLFAVPLVVETLYKNIWNSAAKQGKDRLLRKLISVSNLLLKIKVDLRKVFFRSVMDAFGGNLNLIISGGAPINEKYIDGFRSLGITVLNGYGITECGPVVAVNRNQFIVPGSVGMPICCNEVMIAENGELLVRGENVMLGYYHDEKMTSQALTDGWFHTGDIGEIDRYGALHITGRIKNLIILGNGENISAELIEQKLYSIPYLKEVIVYGMDNLIVAEVFPDECVSDAGERIDEDIKNINRQLPQNQNIGKIIIRDTEFPKTTTKKIIRKNGEKKHD